MTLEESVDMGIVFGRKEMLSMVCDPNSLSLLRVISL